MITHNNWKVLDLSGFLVDAGEDDDQLWNIIKEKTIVPQLNGAGKYN